jgi:RNA polymerase sigma-70 factor (sigma-E family)
VRKFNIEQQSRAAAEFEAFVMSRRRLYHQIAVAIVTSSDVADDVVQDTFIAIYRRWDDFPARNLDAYCRKMLVNACITAVRKRRREIATDMTSLPEEQTGVGADPASTSSSRVDLLVALRGLSPGYRAVLALRYLEDLPVTEVAEILDISEGTVKSQAARALALLREPLLREPLLHEPLLREPRLPAIDEITPLPHSC